MILHFIFTCCLLYGIDALHVSPLPKLRLQASSTRLLLVDASTSTLTTPNIVPTKEISTPSNDNDHWKKAKQDLQKKDCCVVSIDNNDEIRPHLDLLQRELADNGPMDMDLRARIRTSSSSSENSVVLEDCSKVLESVLGTGGDSDEKTEKDDPCALALQELAIGIASMAEGSTFQDENRGIGTDVFCRIVCASSYRAREPPYHTDKAPFRGYVTLRGVGTEYLNRPSSPWEYLQLRTFGEDGIDASTKKKFVKSAQECQFIVMKGDYYYDFCDQDLRDKEASSWMDNLWTRSRACVHRSPEGNGQRRVIISFDLDDGKDDREWYQVGTKREWRNGLTQRKSRLVA